MTLLNSILHDWVDEHCFMILRNCRRAMHPGARIAVIERIAAKRAGDSAHDRLVARADVNMMVANGGCERSLDGYRRLIQATVLCLERVLPLPGGFRVIETAPVSSKFGDLQRQPFAQHLARP